MDSLSIDRLTLQVPWLSESGGRRLALRVAEGLGDVALGGARDIPALRLELTADPGSDVDQLTRQIVSEILRQIRRQP